MSLLSPILSVFGWFKRNFIDHSKSAASVAVTITEVVKSILANPVTGFLENIIDGITHTGIATEVGSLISAQIPKVLAVELAIEGLPDNATPEQIAAWEQKVLAAFNVTSDKSKLYTTLSAQIFNIIKEKLADGKLTFAEAVQVVEESYLDYQKDLAAFPGIVDLPVGTILSNGNMVVESAADAIEEMKSPNS